MGNSYGSCLPRRESHILQGVPETHTEIFSMNSPLEILDLAGLAALERYQKISTIQERVDVILRESEW